MNRKLYIFSIKKFEIFVRLLDTIFSNNYPRFF